MTNEKKSLGPNPFLYPLPAWLVGSYDSNDKPNVMLAAWGGMACSDPLALSVSIRPSRWTYEAILSRKAFTISVPNEALAVQADYAGIVSGRREDKAAVSGLTMVRAEKVDAPYVAECPVVIECSLLQSVDLGAHTMFIGAIQDVKADPACLGPNGVPCLDLVRPLIFSSSGKEYYGIGQPVGKAYSMGLELVKSPK